MTVQGLTELQEFTSLSLPAPEREIVGAYTGDLLSWVMGRAKADNAWITIMSNVNILAVATLSDVSCIILTESTTLDGDMRKIAEEKGVNVLSTPLTSYEAAVKLSALGI